MVHQELNHVLERNVMDNLFLGRYPVNSAGIVEKRSLPSFQKAGHDSQLLTQAYTVICVVSQRQMCEIAKAISYNAKLIFLDEPTLLLLTVQEVDKLFEMMRMLKKNRRFL